ncbi:MAG TPA: SusD/RagB family nutrient-binding outer membrane lipoprotein [Puia sp.]|uniref:SusD/RagB family nutrient-binding outer membrane lipoprotein n=1 Tax=Puia sp. TaxID=2045100 RepID=UPI002BC83843|nr:SusD/RagB family nutrient-binding outer membrane lipoprotein [Puia sp.]HVU97495.1 SusD/RagB family nutrient-binding outer membrane lipoprotein [Puia sp.]
MLFLFSSLGILFLGACNKQLSPLLNNPSVPSPSAADPDLYLNNLQISFKNFFQNATDLTDQLTRQEIMYGPTYFNAYQPTSFDGIWSTAYENVFLTANTMIPIAEAKGETVHAGIAQALKAYTMITMVDLFGDIPYSQADKGVAVPNPQVDKGAAIYDSAIALLDSAIANFAIKPSVKPATDLFYGGNATNWTSLAKTLLLKAYIQTRLVDNTAAAKITDLVNEDDLINSQSQDFAFSYSTHSQAPDARASHYVGNYGTDNGAGDYIGTWFMWELADAKGFQDPRARYYLYRQIDNVFTDSRTASQTTRQFAIPCLYRTDPYAPGVPYCLVDTGYWGRDHGNNEGIPPDNSLRTTWGLYPAGGAFDYNQNIAIGQSTGREAGAGGNGINPIWLSSYTYFLKAEAALVLGTPGDPKALTIKGVDASFNKVAGFAASIGYKIPTSDTNMLITPTNQQKYETTVSNLYTNAGTTADKLNIIETEFYLAAWGNGVETYNNYRRTGCPNNLQPTLGPSPGDFVRSFFYASVYANYNKNAVQKTTTNVKVFWDTNPDNFVY